MLTRRSSTSAAGSGVGGRGFACLLVLLIAAVSTCATPPGAVSLSPPQQLPSAKHYRRELKRWTRSSTVMRQFDTALRVHATLRSPRFEAAYQAQEAALFKLPPETVAAKRAAAAKAWQDSIGVVIAAATHDSEWNDFDRKQSHWRIFLSTDSGQQLRPSKITLQRRLTATDHVYFPYVGMFYELYHVQFPQRLADGRALVRPDTKQLRLQLVGPLGEATLTWDLQH